MNVVQGDPQQFEPTLPAGYELTATSGATLAGIQPLADSLVLNVNQPSTRAHQFLICMGRSENAFKLDVPILQMKNSHVKSAKCWWKE